MVLKLVFFIEIGTIKIKVKTETLKKGIKNGNKNPFKEKDYE